MSLKMNSMMSRILKVVSLVSLIIVFAVVVGADFVSQYKEIVNAVGIIFSLIGVISLFLGFFSKKVYASKQSTKLQQQAFYRNFSDEVNQLDLSIINDSATEFKHKPGLNDVYFDQRVQIPIHSNEDKDALGYKQTHETRLLIDALSETDNQRLVILGKVGSGKSSFVNYLAWQLCQDQLGNKTNLPKLLKDRPVIRLVLRNIVIQSEDKKKQNPHGLLKSVIKKQFQEYSGEVLEQAFDEYWGELTQRGIILLDGLDEVPESKNAGLRSQLVQAIESLAKSVSPSCYVLVTSRPHAYTEKTLTHFDRWEFQAMDNSQIQGFLQHWYQVMRQAKKWSNSQAREKAAMLFSVISQQHKKHLIELAESPLLLTLMASLHYAKGVLPNSRAELYESAIDLLLVRWHSRLLDDEMDENEKLVLSQPPEELKHSLANLALFVHQRQAKEHAQENKDIQDITQEEVMGHLGKGVHNCHPQQVMDFLQFRSGILVASEQETLKFSHRSFQEYLAAFCLLHRADQLNDIRAFLALDVKWWQEVFLLLINRLAKVTGGSALNLINDLMLSDNTTDSARRNILLSKAFIEQEWHFQSLDIKSCEGIKHDLQAALLKAMHLDTLPIKERADAGRCLSQIGDHRSGVLTRENDSNIPDIEWIRIGAGDYLIGSLKDDSDAYGDEKPQHSVSLKSYSLAKYPVTNAQYACFVKRGGYDDEDYWTDEGWLWRQGKIDLDTLVQGYKGHTLFKDLKNRVAKDIDLNNTRFSHDLKWNQANLPVVGISWYEAMAYCQWLSAETKQVISLPTEVQWEAAVRGQSASKYPRSDKEQASWCNSKEIDLGETTSVGLFLQGDSALGLSDMSGNVWEWTHSRWGHHYKTVAFSYPYQTDEREEEGGYDLRVVRGGSWYFNGRYLRSAMRYRFSPAFRRNGLGFRLSLGH